MPIVDDETFRRLCRSRDYMADSLGERIKLADAAEVACFSPFHYQRMFGQAFGETPHEFLKRRRLEKAKQLLASSNREITEVCLEVGYESLGSFSSLFRSTYGMPPQEYRRTLRKLWASAAIPPSRFIPSCYLRFYGIESS